MGPVAEKSPEVRDHSSVIPVAATDDRYRQIAPIWHTFLVLATQAALSYRGRARLQHLSVAGGGSRIHIYEQTIIFEWLMLGLVLGGVWWHGSSLLTVLGQRWTSLSRFLRDLGIGVLFLMGAIVMGSVSPHESNQAVRMILPQGRAEMWLWVALSLSAGICEEGVYRGY